MTESQFIKENIDDWKELEELLKTKHSDPDRLQVLFVKVSGDLSYARTNYSRRAVKPYLNSLLNKVFDSLRTRKKQNIFKKLVHFYQHTLPSEIIYNYKAFLVSLFVFTLAICIGVFSSIEDSEFLKQVLGDQYVNMTEENINNGDPMAVYKDENMSMMFLAITVNNIKVAFLTFVLGIMASIGSVFVLIRNGIMLGAFQTFFYQKGLFLTSFLTIWIHGTIEISSIIVAGAAGIILGNGILFPGTFTRGVALRESAVRSLTVLISTVPLFVIAGFLEGFVTRQTELPTFVKVMIILVSLLLILYVYVIHPMYYYRSGQYNKNEIHIDSENDQVNIISNSVIQRASKTMRSQLKNIFKGIIIPSLLVISFLIYFLILNYESTIQLRESVDFFDYKIFMTPLLFVIGVILTAVFVTKIALISNNKSTSWISTIKQLIQKPSLPILFSIIMISVLYFISFWGIMASLFIIPFPAFARGIKKMLIDEDWNVYFLFDDIKFYYNNWVSFLIPNLIIGVIVIISYFTIETSVGYILQEYLNWHELFDAYIVQNLFYSSIINIAVGMIVFLFGYYYFNEQYIEINNKKHAVDLHHEFKSFGLKQNI